MSTKNGPVRVERNPQTGDQIQIKPKTVVKFRVAKAAKDAITPKKVRPIFRDCKRPQSWPFRFVRHQYSRAIFFPYLFFTCCGIVHFSADRLQARSLETSKGRDVGPNVSGV